MRDFGLRLMWNGFRKTRPTSHTSHFTHHASRRFVLAAYFFFIIVPSLPLTSVSAVTTQEVEEALTCQCGCGLTVHSCNHLQCGFAVPAKQTILDLVSQGKTKDEIIASFTARYGEKVLSAPTTTGFNLAAWITPFFAVVVGGVLIGVMSLRWAHSQPHTDDNQPREVTATTQQWEKLKKELDSFEG